MFHAPPENYLRFTEEQAIDGKSFVWSKDKVLSHYVSLTDRMVGILDGSAPQKLYHIEEDGEYNWNFEQSKWTPDDVVWLAKSAVPVSELVSAFWEQLAEKDMPKPRDEYLAIDRRDYLGYMGVTDPYDQDDNVRKEIDISKVPQELVSRIRAYFVEGDIDIDNWEEDVWNKPTRLDGKNVLIVDEVQNSGATLEIAIRLIKAAIPEADIAGTYFWDRRDSVPIWYPKKRPGKPAPGYGRMVASPNPEWWNQFPDTPENAKRKLAAFVLPTPFHHRETLVPYRDQLSDQLAQDIAYMTYDYANGNILNRPLSRDDDGWDMVLAKQGLTPEDIAAWNEKGGFDRK